MPEAPRHAVGEASAAKSWRRRMRWQEAAWDVGAFLLKRCVRVCVCVFVCVCVCVSVSVFVCVYCMQLRSVAESPPLSISRVDSPSAQAFYQLLCSRLCLQG